MEGVTAGNIRAADQCVSEKRRNLLEQVFRNYDGLLKGYLRRLVPSGDDVRDIAHETYVRIGRLDNFDGINDLRSYVFRTASNIAHDRLRQVKLYRQTYTEDLPVGVEVASAEPTPEQRAIARERFALLCAAIEGLPERSRKTLLMHRLDRLTHAEIGRRLGVSESMAKKYLAQALIHCRESLNPLQSPQKGAGQEAARQDNEQ